MAERRFTILDQGETVTTHASVSGERVRLSPAAVQAALGWELKPQGLCKDRTCIPVGAGNDLVNGHGVDLAALAALLSRPLAVDTEAGVAYLGASAAERSRQLASLEAPDFTLPDLNGTLHSLSDFRGNKVLLVAYASW